MPFVWIGLGLLALFVIFLLAPAIVAVETVYARRDGTRFDALVRTDPQFIPYAEPLRAGRAYLDALGPEKVETRAADGVLLRGLYYDLHADRTVLFLHGYRSDPMINFAAQGESFARRGWNVLLVDQRAHWESGGTRTGLGTLECGDVPVWANWAYRRAKLSALVVYGTSMGAATAAYASDRLDPKLVSALVIDCGFLSPYEQMSGDCDRRHLPTRVLMPLVRLCARVRLGVDIKTPTTEALARTRIPCFFLHGTADATVPCEKSRTAFAACAAPKALLIADGAAHTLSFLTERERAEDALFTFLSEHITTN